MGRIQKDGTIEIARANRAITSKVDDQSCNFANVTPRPPSPPSTLNASQTSQPASAGNTPASSLPLNPSLSRYRTLLFSSLPFAFQ
ncbi:hypothetical protein SLA2020_314460 [Shorea laevis]